MSSLSLWLRDLPMPDRVRARRAEHLRGLQEAGGAKLRQAATERRAKRFAQAGSAICSLTDRELFLVGLALYWAEGSKDKPVASTEVVFDSSLVRGVVN